MTKIAPTLKGSLSLKFGYIIKMTYIGNVQSEVNMRNDNTDLLKTW